MNRKETHERKEWSARLLVEEENALVAPNIHEALELAGCPFRADAKVTLEKRDRAGVGGVLYEVVDA